MDTVVIKPLFHRNRKCIGLYFNKNQALNVLIRRKCERKKRQICKPKPCSVGYIEVLNKKI
jgi:hypothetical protein